MGKLANPCSSLDAEQLLISLLLALMFQLQRVELPKAFVPVGFQRIGNKAIGRVDVQVWVVEVVGWLATETQTSVVVTKNFAFFCKEQKLTQVPKSCIMQLLA